MTFLQLVERAAECAVGKRSEETVIEDVRRALLQVRLQYDTVHLQAEQKEAKLRDLRGKLTTFSGDYGGISSAKEFQDLELQYLDAVRQVKDAQTNRKVYEHMLARTQREQAIVKEKMLKMEEHLGRKRGEVHRKRVHDERARNERVLADVAVSAAGQDAEKERAACVGAIEMMDAELERRKAANQRRTDFDVWRREVALDAANEAFNASAGNLRKILAIEKLAGNCLQKITFEQVERSQTTEDGFQKIRDVTGLADVMDIVHKFLNRDVEHEQLKSSVKNAELQLESLQRDFDRCQKNAEGMSFETIGKGGEIYKVVESSEQELLLAQETNEALRAALQRVTLCTEQVKRWAARVGHLCSCYEDAPRVDNLGNMPAFLFKMNSSVKKLVAEVKSQVEEGKINRKALAALTLAENKEQEKLCESVDFFKANCKVTTASELQRLQMDARPPEDADTATHLPEERARLKNQSLKLVKSRVQNEREKRKGRGPSQS